MQEEVEDREIKKVIVDTNAFFIFYMKHIDIFYELEKLGYSVIIVPEVVFNELNHLKKKLKGREKIAANVGYSLAIMSQKSRKESESHQEWGWKTPDRGRYNYEVKIEKEKESDKDKTKNVDDVIVELAVKKNAAVLTGDRDLRKRLAKMKITTLYLREGNKLEENS